jgi:nitrate reductase delta subunit
VREPLERFACAFAAVPEGRALQERWIETFEVRRRTGLYMTYFTDGDTRARGVALLRLRKLYRAGGWPMESGELPDFLPVMLEFAGSAPRDYGVALMREHRAGLELLRLALRERPSPYADVVDAVAVALGAPDQGDGARLEKLLRDGPPAEQVGVEGPAPPFAGGAAGAPPTAGEAVGAPPP